MKKYSTLIVFPLFLSLLGASSPNFIQDKSKIRHMNIMCKKQLVSYKSESFSTLSNVKKDTVATLTFNYEVYQMYKGTELLTTYHPGFLFLYQIDMYINNNVQYKGGFLNWMDAHHAGFLDSINISAEFNDIDYTGHSYQTPCFDTVGKTSGYRFLRGLDPHDDLYKKESITTNKQTEYNQITSELPNYRVNYGDRFQDSTSLFSNSYFNSIDEAFDDLNLFNQFDDRLVTYLTTDKTINNNQIRFSQNFRFNNQISYNTKDKKVTYKTDDKLFSGPCKNSTDEDSPFRFTFYGTFTVESSKAPSTIKIDLSMDTYHGSHTALDTFESKANKNIVVHL